MLEADWLLSRSAWATGGELGVAIDDEALILEIVAEKGASPTRPAEGTGDSTRIPDGAGQEVSNAAANAAATASDAAAKPFGSAAAAARAAADGTVTNVDEDGDGDARLLTSGCGLRCSRCRGRRVSDGLAIAVGASYGLAGERPPCGEPGSIMRTGTPASMASACRGPAARNPLPKDAPHLAVAGASPGGVPTGINSSSGTVPLPRRSCGLVPLDESKRFGPTPADEGVVPLDGDGENLPSRLEPICRPGTVAPTCAGFAGTRRLAMLGDGDS